MLGEALRLDRSLARKILCASWLALLAFAVAGTLLPGSWAGACEPEKSAPADAGQRLLTADLVRGEERRVRLDVGANPPRLLAPDRDQPVEWTLVRELHWPDVLPIADDGDRELPPDSWLHLVGRELLPAVVDAIDFDRRVAAVRLWDGAERELPLGALAGVEFPRRPVQPELTKARGGPAAVVWRRHDTRQDALILQTGDELYGELVAGNRDAFAVKGLFGRASAARDDVSALLFRGANAKGALRDGLHVRVRFASPESASGRGSSPAPLLSGVLVAGEPNQLTLVHAALGRVAVPGEWLRRLEFLHAGERLALEPRYRHLGNETRPDFDVAEPEGPEWETRFTLPAAPTRPVYVSLYVIELEVEGPGARYAEQLATGRLRTTLVVNGREVDYLNHLAPRASELPQRLRVPLPAGVLKAGENVIRLVQTPQQDQPDEYDDCGFFDLALEFGAAP